MGYLVYILRCGDGTLYTGCTNDLPRRLQAHQSGRGAKYTRSRLPVELVYQEAVPDRSAALRRGGGGQQPGAGRHQTAGSQAEAGPDRGLPTGDGGKMNRT